MAAQVVCPACEAINRIPDDRLRDAWDRAKCAKCGSPLILAKPINVSGSALLRQIAKTDLDLVVDFWAEWCGPCRMMAPAFADAAGRMAPGTRFLKLDTEAAPDVSASFGIRSIPTMIKFRGGKEIARQSGAMTASQIEQWVRSH